MTDNPTNFRFTSTLVNAYLQDTQQSPAKPESDLSKSTIKDLLLMDPVFTRLWKVYSQHKDVLKDNFLILSKNKAIWHEPYYGEFREKNTTQLLEDIFQGGFDFQSLLPTNCRYATTVGENTQFLVELPPAVHNLTVDSYNYRTLEVEGKVSYKLRMPWQYFLLQFGTNGSDDSWLENSWLFWSKTQINSLKSNVFAPFVPNVDRDGGICLGSTYTDVSMPLAQRVDSIIKQFYSTESIFNEDLQYNLPSKYSDFRKWQTDSKDEFCFLWWPDWEAQPPYKIDDYLLRGSRAHATTYNDLVDAMTYE